MSVYTLLLLFVIVVVWLVTFLVVTVFFGLPPLKAVIAGNVAVIVVSTAILIIRLLRM